MQTKTQFGSTRPYGAGFLFVGWDKNFGYQLYNTKPSGIYNTWKAHAIGKNDQSAQSTLKQFYENDLSLKDGIKLTVKVLKKTLDKNKMNGETLFSTPNRSMALHRFMKLVNKEMFKLVIVERKVKK